MRRTLFPVALLALAAVTGHLAEFGVDVIRVEVLNREAGWAIDDLLLTGEHLSIIGLVVVSHEMQHTMHDRLAHVAA